MILLSKHCIYISIMLGLYILQISPGLFHLFGIKPLFVVVLAVMLAIHEGEFTGAIYGMIAGILCDLSATKLFGLNSIILLICCVMVGLVIIYYMQLSLINAMLLTAATMFFKEIICFYFYYAMWGYNQVHLIFFENMIPELICTILFVPPFYYFIGYIKKKADNRLDGY